jgi:hypothetical protein
LPNLPSLATSYARLEPRLLPSTGITRLPRYYEPLRHPLPPSLSLAGVWLYVRPVHGKRLPVLHRSSCADMPSPISRRTNWVRSSLASPTVAAFPEILIGSASALVIFGTCSAFTHVWPAGSQVAQGDPLHRRLQPFRYLHDCSDCYGLERQLPGGTDPRWKTVHLHGAQNQWLTKNRSRQYGKSTAYSAQDCPRRAWTRIDTRVRSPPSVALRRTSDSTALLDAPDADVESLAIQVWAEVAPVGAPAQVDTRRD